MFDTVVVGIDGRFGGRDSLALARQLADEGADLVLAHVYSEMPVHLRGLSPALAAERERSEQTLEAARAEAGIDVRLCSVGSPSVGRGLHELAERVGADLMVIGSSSRGLAGRVLLSDHTRASLNGAPCAIAVAPTNYAEQNEAWSTIGVGYDESQESEHALAVARELARRCGARVSACEVVSIPALALGGDSAIGAQIHDLVKQAQERLAEQLHDVEIHATYGTAGEELALFAASIDLLVVGSRGYGPVGRLVHGSTLLRLTHQTRCPLLVLPRAASSDHAVGPDSHRETPG